MIQQATILLVEDDPNDIFLMERAFTRARLANPLKVVRDGEEAISYLQGDGVYSDRSEYPVPLMILTDLKMPRRSGFELLEWLQEQVEELRDIPVIVLTASNEVPDVEKARQLGAKSYLVKPGQLEDLVQMMLRLQGFWLLLNKKSEKMAVLVPD
jgi:CheY-like chemotaxis protein